jgi:hypothetical protein
LKRAQRAENPISVRLDNIDAKLREIWILEYRTEGSLRARGAFAVGEQVRVLKSTVELSGATTRIGDKTVLRAESCTLEAQLGPFPRFRPSGREIVGTIASDVKCRTKASDLSFIQIYPRKVPFQATGSATLDVDTKLVRGQLQSGEIRVLEAKTPWTFRNLRFPTTWEATLRVKKPGFIASEATLQIQDGSLKSSLQEARLYLSTHHDVLYQPELLLAQLNIEGLKVDDGRLLQDWSNDPSLPWIRVHPSSLHLEYDSRQGTFDAEARPAFTWDMGDVAYGMQARTTIHCRRKEELTTCPTLVLETSDLSVARDGEIDTMHARLTTSEFSAQLPSKLDASIQLRTGTPLKFLERALGLGFLERAGLSLIELGEVNGTVHLNKDRTTLAGRVDGLTSGKVRVDGRFLTDRAWLSSWLFRTPVGRYGINQAPRGVDFHPLVRADWLSSCESEIRGGC